jgi:hypothetical protein
MADIKNRWVLAALVVLVGIQLVRPDRTNPPVNVSRTIQTRTQMPSEVSAILERACFNCHSYQTQWPWYSHVAPVSWLVASDVHNARKALNMSDWARYDPAKAASRLGDMCDAVEATEMPPISYRFMHSTAKLGNKDVKAVCDWTQAERHRLVPQP